MRAVEIELEGSRPRFGAGNGEVRGFLDDIDYAAPNQSAESRPWNFERLKRVDGNLAARGGEGIDDDLLIRVQLAFGGLQ